MAKTMPPAPPALKIKTLFTPTTFVCLLALSLCSTPTGTHALPIASSSIPSADQDTTLSLDTRTTSSSSSTTDSPRLPSASSSSPFRTVSRPITIKVDLNTLSPESLSSSSSSAPLTLLIERTEQQEKYLRQQQSSHQLQDPEEFARLQQEQDELEKVEQDRDQLLDNQEEEQLDQDPETVRRRQEESLGLWMTDAEFEALSQGANSDNTEYDNEGKEHDGSSSSSCSESESSRFDLYAEDFKEVTPRQKEEDVLLLRSRQPDASGSRPSFKKQRLQRQQPPTEEEMLQWPVINLAQFEDRQDEVQDEYEFDEQL